MLRLVFVVSVAVALGQQTDPPPAFEVASVKSANPEILQHRGLGCTSPSRGRVTCLGWLRYLIAVAYNIRAARVEQEIVGGPKWIDDDLFEIQAVIAQDDRNAFNYERGIAMLRTLLAERFKLTAHRERKEVPSFALVIARKDGKLGPQLQPTPRVCVDWIAAGREGAPPNIFGDLPCGRGMMSAFTMRQTRVPLSQLANLLSARVERPVEDHTGLTGMYAFDLRWMAEPTTMSASSNAIPAAPPPDNLPTSIFTALHDQLGLRLENTKTMADLLVIDHVERPAPN